MVAKQKSKASSKVLKVPCRWVDSGKVRSLSCILTTMGMSYMYYCESMNSQ